MHQHRQWHLSRAELVNHKLIDVINSSAPF